MKGRIFTCNPLVQTVGPGLRFHIVLQGCTLTCHHCTIPGSWNYFGGTEVTIDELLSQIEPHLESYRSSGGGITISGGEPMLQAPFVIELFKQCHSRWSLHTVLDTAGFSLLDFTKPLLTVTDLLIFNLKTFDEQKHIELTGHSNQSMLYFAETAAEIGVPIHVKHVIIPGLTDDENELRSIGQWIAQIRTFEKLIIESYDPNCVMRWNELGLISPLHAHHPSSPKQNALAEQIIQDAINQSLQT